VQEAGKPFELVVPQGPVLPATKLYTVLLTGEPLALLPEYGPVKDVEPVGKEELRSALIKDDPDG
jgi:hypothetical protein